MQGQLECADYQCCASTMPAASCPESKVAPRHQLFLPQYLLWEAWSQLALVELPSRTSPSGWWWCAYDFHILVCVLLNVHSQHGRSWAISNASSGASFALHISPSLPTSSSKGEGTWGVGGHSATPEGKGKWTPGGNRAARALSCFSRATGCTSELPEVQVEHPSSQQGSEDLQVHSESISIGDVSLTCPCHLHLLTTLLGSLWALPNLQYCWVQVSGQEDHHLCMPVFLQE